MVRRVLGVFVGLVTVGACSGAPQAPSAIDRPGVATQPADPVTTSLVGTYSATLALPACTGLPDADRVRRYSARIQRDETTGVHVVTLSGATFLDTLPSRFHPVPMTSNQFLASHDAGVASFALWGDWESSFGGHIIERISSGQWIDVQGQLTGRLGARAITASGAGAVYYCAATTTAFHCEGANWVTCNTTLTLTLVPE